MTKIEEKFPQKLLVEGNDDQHVVWALCKKFGTDESFDVIDCEGVEKLFEQIPQRLKQSDIATLGIIVDADTDINARWESLKPIIASCGFEVPEHLPQEGLICKNADGIRIGVWMMPDNKTNGMLEDFIAFLVPKEDQLLPIAETTLGNIEERKLNKYSFVHKSKAKIHTWLAWQKDPGIPLGQSITKKYLSMEKEACQPLIDWLRRLFEDGE